MGIFLEAAEVTCEPGLSQRMSLLLLGEVVTVGPSLCRPQMEGGHSSRGPLSPLPSGAPQQHLEKPAAHKQPLPTPLSLLPVITALLETPLDIRLGGSASLPRPRFLALKSGPDAKS